MKSQESAPYISVVVLTYNRKDYLENCLNSLFNQASSPEEFEIIVVDDGSTDGTNILIRDLLKKYLNLKYVYQKNQGVAEARNTGIKNATGDIIAFVADDYVLPPHYLNTIKQFFIDYPNAMIVRFKVAGSHDSFIGRAVQLYYEVGFKRYVGEFKFKFPRDNSWLEKLMNYLVKAETKKETIRPVNVEAAGAAAFKKKVFDIVGLFDASLKRTEDSDMSARLIKNGIEIYYNPHLSIVHTHSPRLRDQLKKSFLMGFHRFFYQKKYAPKFPFFEKLRFQIVNIFLFPFWISRQAESNLEFVLYLPLIYLLHTVLCFGFYWAAFTDLFHFSSKKPQ